MGMDSAGAVRSVLDHLWLAELEMTYLYRCPDGHQQIMDHPISAEPVVACRRIVDGLRCAKQMKRVPQGGAAVIFTMGTRKHEVR